MDNWAALRQMMSPLNDSVRKENAMEFHEKLQELRKQKGLTQEELAEVLYVSRTAISKWESGRGLPNIESLKAISGFFSVSIDQLLSGDEVLAVAETDSKEKENRVQDLVFGLLDCSAAMLLFLPFFGQTVDGVIREASLPALTEVTSYLLIGYWVLVAGMILWGILTLAMQHCRRQSWIRCRHMVSLGIHGAATLLFILSRQPYAAGLLFIFLAIKGLILIKKR